MYGAFEFDTKFHVRRIRPEGAGAALACMLAMPILTTVMNFTGMIGGWVAETAISGMSFEAYFRSAFSVVGFADYVVKPLH